MKKEADQEGGVRGHRAHLPPQTKMHLNVQQFSRKTNWKPTEGLLYNQGCKKDIHITG